jgi:hypothetical protein
MAKSQVGSGRSSKYMQTDIGATVVPTRPSDRDEDREGFSQKRFLTQIPMPEWQKNKNGLAGPGGYDCLPGESGK